jgi:hypothetical protein
MAARLHDGSVLRWLGQPFGASLLIVGFVAIIFVAGPEIATAIAAAVALVGGIATLSHADTTARRSRTATYRERWDSPDLLDARVVTSEFLTLYGSNEDARWQQWNEWIEKNLEARKRLQIMAILNFWEEVAGAFNQDLLDDSWFRTDLAWLLKGNWERASWFIRKFRTEFENAGYFCEWQIAVESVRTDVERQQREGLKALEAVEDRDPLYAPQKREPGAE